MGFPIEKKSDHRYKEYFLYLFRAARIGMKDEFEIHPSQVEDFEKWIMETNIPVMLCRSSKIKEAFVLVRYQVEKTIDKPSITIE